MAIDSNTLENWASSQTAATTSAKDTHKKIREELESSNEFPDRISFDTYLQGSYANATLVRGSSDVDVVVRLTSTVLENASQLSTEETRRWKDNLMDPGYSWNQFRTDVIASLEDRFGSNAVIQGDKALALDSSALPLDADVLVCQQYRRYYNYPSGYYTGIAFWDLSNNQIVNYPKRHIKYGSKKQSSTNDRFKETVRIFKRARNYLVAYENLQKDTVPSYFIENLLYHVPDGQYVYDKQDRFMNVVDYLNKTDYSDWTCQNGITPLFGSGSTKWDTRHADSYVNSLISLWNNW